MSDAQLSLFGNAEPAPPTPPTAAQYDRIPLDPNAAIVPGTYNDLNALSGHCRSCQRCGLSQQRTNVVISRGNPQADLMVIGEGPGQQEDEQGKPFVGKSGQLLEKILASVQFDSEQDVYIANVVKCRPPGNRDPRPEEVQACRPYLLEQIRLVDPKIILFTGATAYKALTGGKQGITKIRGKWMEWEGRQCMPILHPAYLLRNPSREKGKPKWSMWQDIQAIRAKYDALRRS